MQQEPFGDLQFKTCGGQPCFGERGQDQLDEARLAYLCGRKIDGDAQPVPGGGTAASRAQHPGAELADHPGAFGQRDELCRRHHAVLAAVPSHERLGPDDLSTFEGDQRLEMHFERAFGQRLAQIPFHVLAPVQAGVQAGVEEAVGAASLRLGLVQRHVGLLQQQGGGGCLVRVGA